MLVALMEMAQMEPPTDEDCCNSGCDRCVHDIYQNHLMEQDKLRKKLETLNVRFDLLSQTKFKSYRLIEKTKNCRDVYLFRFQPFQVEVGCDVEKRKVEGVLPIRPGQHLVIRNPRVVSNSKERGRDFTTREYTPITVAEHVNGCTFDIVVRVYENGTTSTSGYLNSLQVGAVSSFRGPYGSFQYTANEFKCLLLVCMGTGIAPMVPVAWSVLNNEHDETYIRMHYGCKNADSIILRNQLKEMSSFWNFHLRYYLSEEVEVNGNYCQKFGEAFKYGRIVEEDIVGELAGKHLDKYFVLICGNEHFNKNVFESVLRCGILKENVHVF